MSTSGLARDDRGRTREGPSHSRATAAATLSFPTLRATAASTCAASPSVSLLSSIQSRPLQANPAAPLLWNGSSTHDAAAQLHRSRSTLSSSSTLHSSARDSIEGRQRSQRSGSEGNDRRGSTMAHVLRPQKPEQSRAAPSTRAPQGEDTPASSRTVNTTVGRAKKATAVNYNALFQQEQNRQQPSPSPVPLSPHVGTTGYAGAAATAQKAGDAIFRTVDDADDAGEELMSGTEMDHTSPYRRGGPTTTANVSVASPLAVLGAVEGPLPPDVRRLISQSCGADPATLDGAEQQARRLISTGRRVKVYREELAAAEEERRDWTATAEQRRLVRSVLQEEVDGINARIQALLQERAICEAQLQTEDAAAARETRKLAEAEERVTVLRQTIDGIVEETTVPRLMLQQLVPSLLIENYI
ncbi:hypothetical protein ABB37_07809 [Leptomonas pyrrhocoris]|uniref:Uncharacterized protein n=1 Tax=Leptomonas pyrrhocoris TaxID=157538 RepID=A0A0M9FV00_LEPPY|nr:hypothetical protein ABB37_07809 [Leptomonas pyrrhocoris]KPA76509.1 hypothetical protein ABB37_07809 [Leptomonas pyrrhocoris]|eukprot:XP_015654948.1 hypothetical protein ABB37_07809 [Leptomonas pyrrhocoris]